MKAVSASKAFHLSEAAHCFLQDVSPRTALSAGIVSTQSQGRMAMAVQDLPQHGPITPLSLVGYAGWIVGRCDFYTPGSLLPGGRTSAGWGGAYTSVASSLVRAQWLYHILILMDLDHESVSSGRVCTNPVACY